jgi:cytochrome c biogenesis protein ResB
MYLAFIIIMVGTVMCIFSQRRLWLAIRQNPDQPETRQVLVMYRTNKAKLSFKKELKKLYASLQQQLNPQSTGVSAP